MKTSELTARRTARTREAVAVRMTRILEKIAELLGELRVVREELRQLERDERGGSPVMRRTPAKRLLGTTRPVRRAQETED